MAMAIHSAKIASEWTLKFLDGQIDRAVMEAGYAKKWKKMLASRLRTGRQVQRLFGK